MLIMVAFQTLFRLGYAMTLFTNPSNELIPPVLQLINAVAFAALDHELTHAEAAGFLCRLAGQQPQTTATSSDVITLIVDMFWVTEVQYETCNPEKLGDLHALARAIIVSRPQMTTPVCAREPPA
jgi:hypothetical protein